MHTYGNARGKLDLGEQPARQKRTKTMQTLDLSREASASVTRFAHFRVSIGANTPTCISIAGSPRNTPRRFIMDKAHHKSLLVPGRFRKREGSILRQACTRCGSRPDCIATLVLLRWGWIKRLTPVWLVGCLEQPSF